MCSIMDPKHECKQSTLFDAALFHKFRCWLHLAIARDQLVSKITVLILKMLKVDNISKPSQIPEVVEVAQDSDELLSA